MIYLKPFNKLFESNDLKSYQPILPYVWRQSVNSARLTKKLILLSQLDSKSVKDYLVKLDIVDFNLVDSKTEGTYIDIINDNKKIRLIVNKDEDDWFFIKEYFYRILEGRGWVQLNYYSPEGYGESDSKLIDECHYKCDQIEGLLELIKDRINNLL